VAGKSFMPRPIDEDPGNPVQPRWSQRGSGMDSATKPSVLFAYHLQAARTFADGLANRLAGTGVPQ
jgi:hypothetical protein